MSPRLPARLLAAQSDRRLVELIAVGHERAFEVLVQRHRRALLRYCSRMGLSEQLCEDVVQHTLLQAWVALGRGTEVREPRAWLYRIAHNAAVNAVTRARDEHLRAGEAAIDMPAALALDPERRLAIRDTLADVAALPALQREAIVLSAINGRSHEEVASALGVSDGAVRGLLYRARVTLRAAAAALTPAPLIGWASGAASRVTPTAARIAELGGAGAGSEASAVLLKGAALAATAALAAGAVLGPLHTRHQSARHPARASARVPALGALGAPVAGRRAGLPVGSRAVAAVGNAGAPNVGVWRAAGGSPHATAEGSPTRRVAALTAPSSRSGSGSSPGAPGTSGARAPDTQSPTVPSAVRGEAASAPGSGAGPGTAAQSQPSGSSGTSGGSGTAGSAGSAEAPPPPPPPKPTGGGTPEHEESSEKAEQEAEAARELKEREAEKAREAREREEEAARELREREAEKRAEATDK